MPPQLESRSSTGCPGGAKGYLGWYITALGALMLGSLWVGKGVTNPVIDDVELSYKSEIMAVRRKSASFSAGSAWQRSLPE